LPGWKDLFSTLTILPAVNCQLEWRDAAAAAWSDGMPLSDALVEQLEE
jgi:hypothetical protein